MKATVFRAPYAFVKSLSVNVQQFYFSHDIASDLSFDMKLKTECWESISQIEPHQIKNSMHKKNIHFSLFPLVLMVSFHFEYVWYSDRFSRTKGITGTKEPIGNFINVKIVVGAHVLNVECWVKTNND